MVVASKIFKWPIYRIHCSQMPLHEGRTCLQSYFYDWYRCSLSGLGYYAPLVLTPSLIKARRMDKKKLLETLKFYLETVFASSFTATSVLGLICLFRNHNGKFSLPTFILAFYLGSQFCCLFYSKRTLNIFVMATTQVVLELLLRQHKNPFTNFVLNSKILQSLLFMLSSSIIMHFKRKRLYNGFWFLQPEKSLKFETATKKSSIKEKFQRLIEFLLNDMKTYITYGLGLDAFSFIMKIRRDQRFPKAFLKSVMKIRLNMTYFFISYVLVYRIILYLQYSYAGNNQITDVQHFIASCFGGISYIFINKLTVNSFTLILAIQTIWQHVRNSDETKTQKSRFLKMLLKLPFGKMLFPINIAYIIYSFYILNDSVNSLGKTLLNAVTDQKVQRVFSFLTKHDEHYIMQNAMTKPALGVF